MKKLLAILPLLLLACSNAGPGTGPGIGGADGKGGVNGGDGSDGVSGNDGQDGIDGDAGVNGKDGIDNRISKTWKCDFTLARIGADPPIGGGPTTCTDTGVSVKGWYYAAQTKAGDTFVRAGSDYYVSVGGGALPGHGASSSYFWAAGTWEGDNGMTWLLQDICSGNPIPGVADPTGNWAFQLNKQTNRMTATYTDPDVFDGKTVVNTVCTTNAF